MADIERVRSNVRKMLDQNAPESDIDAYLAGEGVTAAQLRQAKQAPKPSIGRQLLDATKATALGVQDALTFGAADELAAIAPTVTGIGGKFGDYEGNRAALAQQNRRDMAKAPVAALGGQVAGGVAMGAVTGQPQGFARAVGRAAAEGAAYGFGASEGDVKDRLSGAARSAAGAAAGSAALQGVARVLSPKGLSGSARKLADEGVTMTPGQAAGGIAKATEDRLAGLPGVGDIIQTSRRRGSESFTVAAVNRVLKPLGQTLPSDVAPGNKAVEYAQNTVSAAYDDLLPKLNIRFDQKFAGDADNIVKSAQKLPESQRQQFQTIVGEIVDRFSKGGETGRTFKVAQSEIKRLARSYRGSAVAGERELGGLLGELDDAMFQAVRRANPTYAPALKNINRAFANLVRVERAAAGAKDGLFSPAQLQVASRVADGSRRKSASAAGKALMQDLAIAGRDVLPSTVPDSGTAGRLLLPALALGGGAGITQEDNRLQTLGALSLLAAGAYSPAGQRAAQTLLDQRPQSLRTLAEILQRGRGGASVGGAVLALPPSP